MVLQVSPILMTNLEWFLLCANFVTFYTAYFIGRTIAFMSVYNCATHYNKKPLIVFGEKFYVQKDDCR